MDGIIVERIPINRIFKKRVKFQFGMWVWISIAEKHKVFLDDLDKVDPEKLGIDALFFAAQWGEFTEGKRRTITYEKFEKWAELIPAMQMARINKCLQQSRVGGKSIMQIASESKKKQAVKK